jgi:hypothetical protein
MWRHDDPAERAWRAGRTLGVLSIPAGILTIATAGLDPLRALLAVILLPAVPLAVMVTTEAVVRRLPSWPEPRRMSTPAAARTTTSS